METSETKRSAGRRAIVVGAVLAHVCALVAVFGVGWFAHAFWGGEKITSNRAGAHVPAVAVDEVKAERFNPPEEFIGHVEPVQEVDILPQIEGYVKEVKFAEGDEVKAGDLLFVIDDERYRAD